MSRQFIIFLICFFIFATHRIDAIVNPQFWAEDGVLWYSDAYNLGVFKALFISNAGYFQIVSRLVGGIAQFLPLSFAPLFFNFVALACQSLVVTLWLSPRFNFLVPSFSKRVLLAVPYFALQNSWETHSNLTNTQWHLAILAILIVFAEPSSKKLWQIFDVFFIALSSLSGPFCIISTPILIVICIVKNNKWCWVLWGISSFGALIQLLHLISSLDERTKMELGASFTVLTKIIGGQIFLGAIVGQRGYSAVFHIIHKYTVLENFFFLFVFVIGIYLIFRAWSLATLEFKIFLLYSVFSTCLALKSPMVNTTQPQWPLMMIPGVGSRYWLYPTLIFSYALIIISFNQEAVKLREIYQYFQSIVKGDFLLNIRKASKNISISSLFVSFQQTEKIFCHLLLTLMCAGACLNWLYTPFVDYDFYHYTSKFSNLSPGETITIPINPKPWSFSLVKHEQVRF